MQTQADGRELYLDGTKVAVLTLSGFEEKTEALWNASGEMLGALREAREALHNMRRDFKENDCANGTPKDDACPCTLHRIRAILSNFGA